MKLVIYVFLTLGSVLGGWLGSLLNNGALLGPWSILFGLIGGLAGVYVGYKINQRIMS